MKAYLKYCFTGTGAKAIAAVTLVAILFILYWVIFQSMYALDILYTTITLGIVWVVFFIGNYFSYRKLNSKT